MNSPYLSPYLTAPEAAAYLRYPSVHAFQVAVKRRGIPVIRIGRRMFFTVAQLDSFMAIASEASRPRARRTA